jgi:DNA repair protein RadA/Sms
MKTKTIYICQSCGHKSPKWMGQCPSCGLWHTLAEEIFQKEGKKIPANSASSPVPLNSILFQGEERFEIGLNELDRVLGGGIVKGSVILLGGEPGIGKSTVLMQAFMYLSQKGLKTLYISGEESVNQIKMRAQRLGSPPNSLYVSNEVNFENIRDITVQFKPDIIGIDSIQTIYSNKLDSSPGSVSQVREVAYEITMLCKALSVPAFIVGHVTKDGSIAGPRVLEHIVDTVLYFEGEGDHAYRIIRAIKNRFGPVHELGIFEMTGAGLKEVENPSCFFLENRAKEHPGSVVFAGMEGTRPMLLEVQALVSKSHIAIPRRTATGFDNNRLAMLISVAERTLDIILFDKDIFVNIVGGFKISEPAADLAVITAIYSSFIEKAAMSETIVFGETGLTGEIRGVVKAEFRLKEAMRLGFKNFIIPDKSINIDNLKEPYEKINFFGIKHLSEIKEFLDI